MGLRYLGNIIRPGYDPLASNITTGVNTAQHQGVFTLQQQAQAQSTQSWVTEPLFDFNTLLLQADGTVNGSQNNTFLDSSSNSFAITRNGNTTQGSFTPFSQAPGYWSNYFVGANADCLSITNNAAFDFGTGDFTIEAWINPSSIGASQCFVCCFATSGTGFSSWAVTVSSTGYLNVTVYDGGAAYNFTATNNPIPANLFTHVALTRSSGTSRLFVNGNVCTTTGSVAPNVNSGGWPLFIGRGAYVGYTDPFTGYVSNLRIIKGAAAYTSSFTPSTTKLNVFGSGTTSLLSCQSSRFVDNGNGNSGSGFTISVNTGTPSVQAFSPFAPQFQWTPSVIGGSGYFDGTGDYLTTADNSAFDFGSGNFTIECWAYPMAWSSVAVGILGKRVNTGVANQIGLEFSGSTGVVRFAYSNAGSEVGVTGAVGTLNAWQHIAIVRNGSALTIYQNGVVTGSATISVSIATNANALAIGAVASNGDYPFNGYISSLRLVKGTAVYTGAFTPPIAPVGTSGPASSYSSTTNVNTTFTSTNTSLLTNFTNAGIYDGTMKNNLETTGNVQVSTSITRYGSGSIFFDGSGDYLTLPNAPQTIGVISPTTNLTIEGWIYHTQRPAFAESGLIGDMAPTAGTNYWSFGPNQNGYLVWYSFSNATQTATSTQIPLNTWTHIAVSIQNGTIRLFVNGVLQAFTGSAALTTTSSSIGYITMGQWNNSSNYAYFGYVDDFRITRAARYITSFTPPRVALPRQ